MASYTIRTKRGSSYTVNLADGEDIDSVVAQIEAEEEAAEAKAPAAPVAKDQPQPSLFDRARDAAVGGVSAVKSGIDRAGEAVDGIFREAFGLRDRPAPSDLLSGRRDGQLDRGALEFASLSPSAQQAEIERRMPRPSPPAPTMRAIPERTSVQEALDATVRKPFDRSLAGAAVETVGDAARGVIQAGQDIREAGYGGLRLAGEAIGSDELVDIGASGADRARNAAAFIANPSDPGSLTQSAARGVAGSAPALAMSLAGGAAWMIGTSGLREFDESMSRGEGMAASLKRGAVMGVAEWIGESPAVGSAKGLIGKVIKGKSTREVAENLADLYIKDGLGEQVTLALQSAFEKTNVDGRRPDMKLADYLEEAIETAKVSLIASTAMGGGGLAAGKAGRFVNDATMTPSQRFGEALAGDVDATGWRDGGAPAAGPGLADYEAAVSRVFSPPRVEQQPATVITPEEILSAPLPQQDQAGSPAAGPGATRATPAAPTTEAGQATTGAAPAAGPIDLNDPNAVVSTVFGAGAAPSVPGANAAGGPDARGGAGPVGVPAGGMAAGQPGGRAADPAGGAFPVGVGAGSTVAPAVGSTNAQQPLPQTGRTDVPDSQAGGGGQAVPGGPADPVARIQSEWNVAIERATAAGRAADVAGVPRDLRPVSDPKLVEPLREIAAAISEATGFADTTGERVVFVESDQMPDGLNYQGRAVVNVKGMQKPAVFIAGHEISHTWQNLAERAATKARLGQALTQDEADAQRIWAPVEQAIWDMIPESSREAYAYAALSDQVKGRSWANLQADPKFMRTLRREMAADFHGKRLSDPATVNELARRAPEHFGDYAKKVIGWINSGIAKLRGSKGGELGANDIDQHLKDLTRAKLIWTDAMISWRKRGGASAAPVVDQSVSQSARRAPARPIAKQGEPLETPSLSARLPEETDKQFAKRVVDKREKPASLPETYDSYFKMDGATVVPLSSLVSTKSDEQNQQGGDNGPKRMAAAAVGELSKRAPITVMPSAKEPGKYEVVDGNGTLTSVKSYGWKALPVTVVDRAKGEKLIADDKREEDLKKKAKLAAPYVGEALAKEMVDAAMSGELAAEMAISPEILAKGEQLAAPLLERAAAANEDFGRKLKAVAEELGAEHKHGPLKKAGRTAEKLATEHRDEVSAGRQVEFDAAFAEATLKDLVRGSLIFESEQAAMAAIDRIRERYDVLRVKDRFAKPLPTGYRDVLINVRLDNGTIAEIQLHIPGMFYSKDLGHEVYGIERSLPDGKKKGELVALQARFYGKAYDFSSLSRSAMSPKNSSSVAGAPLTTTLEKPTGLPDSAEKNSRFSNEPTTGEPSTSINMKPGSAALARQSNTSFTGDSNAETTPGNSEIVNQGSLYVSRPVVNPQKLHAWATAAGIQNVVPADKMHVSVVYSRTPVKYLDLGPAPDSATAVTGRLARIGKGNDLVLMVSAPALVQRHKQAIDAGATWDHDRDYSPHITLSYSDKTTDIASLQPPVLKFTLGQERPAALKRGWSEAMEDDAPSQSARQFDIKTLKEGSLKVLGDADAIRALLPDDIKGRKIPGGMLFSPSAAPRAKAALEGRKLAYSRAGQVIDKLPMKDGKYVGAPEKFNTPQKIPQLRKVLRQLAEEGAPGRFWYENSSKEVLQMVGGDVNEARKFVALLAIYSPQAKVDTNSTFALRAWSQYKAGQPINVKTKVMDDKATAALSDIDAFWSGEKTGNFFNNLLREIDPSVADKQGATIDMWMMRAAQYEGDAPSATQYAFMENENNRIARDLGWEPQQVQAAIWVAMKARTENKGVKKKTEAVSEKRGWIRWAETTKGKPVRVILNAQKHRDNWLKHAMEHDVTKGDTQAAKFDFSDGLRRHIGQISWEARPGRSTGILPGVNDAPYDQQVEFQQAVQKALYSEEGADLLAQQLGLLVDGPDILAPGAWQGEIAAGMQKQVAMAPGKGEDGKSIDPSQKKALDLYAATLGMLLRQEGVGWHRPFYKGLKSAENGVELRIGRPMSPDEAKALWAAVDERMRAAGVADWEQRAGMISSPVGMRLVNFGAVDNNAKFRDLILDAASTLAIDEVDPYAFASDGNLITNDWKEAPSGQGFADQVRSAGRPDLLRWSRDVLAPRVQAVFDEFSGKYGWGNPGRVEDLFDDVERPSYSARSDAAGDRRDRGVPEGSEQGSPTYGVATPGAAAPVEAIHFSQQQRSSLSSAAYGTGLRGAEMERVMRSSDTRLRQRAYFYVNQGTGVRPESGVGAHAHRVTLANLYDTAKGEIKGAGNDFESAVLDAGYDGYLVRLPGSQSGQAVLLGAHSVPVQYLGLGGAVNAAPAPASQASAASSTRQGDDLVSRAAPDVAAIRGKAEVQAVAPSFRFEFGKARVRADEVEQANAALEQLGSELSFSRRSGDLVSPQSVLDAAIDEATRVLEGAIERGGQMAGLGRTSHVLGMLGARPVPLVMDGSVVRKVFIEKHAGKLEGIPAGDIVRGLYRPAMVFQQKSRPNEYELVLPVVTPQGPLTAAILVDGDRAAVKSIYPRSWIRAESGPALRDFMLNQAASKPVYIDEYLGLIAATGNEDARAEAGIKKKAGSPGDQRPGVTSPSNVGLASPAQTPAGSGNASIARPGAPVNRAHFVAWKDLRALAMKFGKLPGEQDLLRWIGDNYKGDPADAPSFSARQTDTPEFKRWFGDSKVVDAEGKPLVVYHGTTGDFDTFSRIDGGNAYGPGHYFTADPAEASGYAEGTGGGRIRPSGDAAPNVMPVYLSAQNIYTLDDSALTKAEIKALEKASNTVKPGSWTPGELAKAFDSAYRPTARNVMQYIAGQVGGTYTELAQAAGYDGLRGSFGYVVFRPEQIKSATGNDGSFDPDDANISSSARQPTLWRDELGRLRAPTGKLAAYYGGILNTWLAKVGMNYMGPELKRQFREMKIQLQKAQDVTIAVAREGFKMSEAERELVSDIIEGELQTGVVPPSHAVQMAMGMQAVLGQQTDELVALGMLSKDSADLWRGKYLPRFYKPKFKDQMTEWGKALQQLIGRKPIMAGVQGKRLKSRGLWETVTHKSLSKWEALGWQVRDPDYDPATATARTEVQIWRDFTREERDKMGEIRDAGFRFVMGYQQAQRDIAYGKLFKGIADNIASKKEKPGFVQVPDGTVEGTGVKRYGALAGMWVPLEVLQHLKAMDSGAGPAMQMYRKAMSLWKEGKVVLNPVSHANNVISNITMAHFAGVSYWDVHKYAGAARDLATGKGLYQEAKDAGLMLGTMGQEELMQMLPPELQALVHQQKSTGGKLVDGAFNVLTFSWTRKGEQKGLRKWAAKAYEAEDVFFRYMIYRDARARGLTPTEAVDHSQRYMFTYDDLPVGAQRIRDFGLPFFAYTYKVIPALLHTAANYPHRILAPAAVLYGLNAAMYALAAGDDDEDWLEKLKAAATDPERQAKMKALEEDERANLPPWMKGSVSIGAQKAIRLHTDDVLGLPVFWDVGQIMPGGNMFDTQNNTGGVALPQSLTVSHPLFTTMGAMFMNRDSFFGKDIVDKTDTGGEAAQKRAEWLWRQFSPAISFGNYHWERGLNILAQQTGEPVSYWPWRDLTGVDKSGMPITPGYTALQTVGIKVRPVDTERNLEIEQGQRQALMRDIDKELRNFKRQYNAGYMSEANYEANVELARLKKERLREGLNVDGEKP